MSTDSNLDKRTKAQMLEELGAFKAKVHEWEQRSAKQADANKQAEPKPVVEADALRECVRALDWVKARTGDTYGNGQLRSDVAAIDRLLRHLASKYGVPLIDVQVRDCARPHLDDIPDYNLAQAVRSAAMR